MKCCPRLDVPHGATETVLPSVDRQRPSPPMIRPSLRGMNSCSGKKARGANVPDAILPKGLTATGVVAAEWSSLP